MKDSKFQDGKNFDVLMKPGQKLDLKLFIDAVT